MTFTGGLMWPTGQAEDSGTSEVTSTVELIDNNTGGRSWPCCCRRCRRTRSRAKVSREPPRVWQKRHFVEASAKRVRDGNHLRVLGSEPLTRSSTSPVRRRRVTAEMEKSHDKQEVFYFAAPELLTREGE